jgi:hypothetical protein
VLLLTACSPRALDWSANTQNSISGSVVPFGGAQSHGVLNPRALTCVSATASLYLLESNGSRKLPAAQTVSIQADGTYIFTGLRSLGVKVSNRNKLGSPYLVEVNGCNASFARLLTATDKQDITWGSTLVSYITNSTSAPLAAKANATKLDSLYSSLSPYTTFADAYSAIQSSSLLASDLQDALGVAPAVLQDASPKLLGISIPSTMREGETAALTVSTTQWDTNYNYAYEWRMDSTAFSTSANATYVPTGNFQGSHTVTVYWGQLTAGNLDLSKPYQSQSFPISVENNVLPSPPPLGAASTSVNMPVVQLRLQTGAAFANCDTFSALAITEDLPVAPMVPSQYNIFCTTAGTQTLSYPLVGGVGTHNLYLWAIDAAGAISATPQLLNVTYSLIVPNVTITAPVANLPTQNSVTVSGACDDSAGDVTFTGGINPASVVAACSGSAYSKLLNLSAGDGSKTITASQTNQFNTTGSANITVLRDTTPPVASITSLAPAITNATSFAVNVSFSEAVTDFSAAKISATNGTVSAFTGSGSAYSFTLTPSAQGSTTVNIAAGAVHDAAGNSNAASASLSRVFDTVAPSVSLASATSSPTNISSIPVTVTFSEAVTSFTAAGLQATNATISGLTGNGTTYSFQLLPAGQGTVSVSVLANAGQDAGGNGNTASSALTKVFDSVAPTLILSTTAPDPTNVTPIPVTAVFSESITGFNAGKISVTNGSVSGFTGSGATYTFNVTPSGLGAVNISAAGSAGTDAAGNGSVAANLSRDFNNSSPSVTVTSTRTSPTNAAAFPITVTFSTSVTGFTSSDISVVNGAISAFAGSGTSYTFTVTPSSQGAVAINVPAAVAQDSAANLNLASNNLSIVYDTIAPTVAFTAPAASSYVNLANSANVSVTGTCSENGQSISLSAGSATATAVCASGAFSAVMDLTALNDGPVSLAATLVDAAGNTGSANRALTKDTSIPSAVLTGTPASPSNAAALNTTVGGSSVTAYKFKVGPAISLDCSVSTDYSAEIAAATLITTSVAAQADGNLKICAIARNAAGNYQDLSSATSFTWVKDTAVTAFSSLAISPTSPGKNTKPSLSGISEPSVTLALFSQAACAGPVIASGTANGSGAFTLTPAATIGADANYSFSVRATDAAGNQLCSSSVAYLLDTIAPTVVISTTAPASTNVSPIPVALAFSEPVTGLTSAGISISNGTISALAGSSANYSFSITPSGQGAVTVSVLANAASDGAGNGSAASLVLTNTYDTVAPNLTVASPSEGAFTKTTALNFSGACETGLTVSISGSGITTPTTTPCAGSAYSIGLVLTSGDGIKNITFAQTDSAGNSSSVTRAVSLDTVAPVFTFTSTAVQNPNTKTNFVTFNGTCETGLPVVVSGTDTGSVSCTGSAWSYAVNNQTSDGTRAYTFKQTDAAGNGTTIVGTWVRDTVAPTIAFSSPASGFTAKDSITLSGTCESGIGISFSGAGLLSTVNIACPSGTFSQLVFFSAGDGSKAVSLTQTDLAGNTATISRSFIRDTTAPAITQITQASPHYNKVNSATFGGACETGLAVVVSGTDSTSITCTGAAWSYTTVNQTSDGTRAYTFTQTDAAGNEGQISATWVRDTIAPALALASPSSFVTSGNSVTFAGTCENGLSVITSGSSSASTPCSGGNWSYTVPTTTTDGNYAYTFTETDLAGNATTVSGTWNRSTSGPVITITQPSPQLTTNGALTISGTCSGGTAGSNGVITITGAVSTSVPCSSTNSSLGTWSYSATQASDGSYNYNFSTTDNFSTPRTSSAAFVWQKDSTLPVITNGSLNVNGGASSTAVSYVPVSFSATDNLTTVAKFCLKNSSVAPLSTDSCWYPVGGSGTGASPANNVSIANYSYNVGIIPQAYSIYLWVMDGAGNISVNSSTSGKDTATITLAPIAPPAVSTVLVSNSDTMNGAASERVISAGSDVFIRWTASGTNLSATPVTIAFSTDDSTWTPIATSLTNGQNNCSSIQGSGSASASSTGCFLWTSGSPTNSYYRIRVSLTNSAGGATQAASLPINSAKMQILAGNTESGLNASASSAFFQANYANPGWVDAQSLTVNSKGVVYFRDTSLGLVSVDPKNGKLTQLIPLGATTSGVGDGGSIASAKLRYPWAIAIDPKDRLLILDYDRIRRVDFSSSPATITTIIGGGGSTGDTVASGTSLAITSPIASLNQTNTKAPLLVSPTGDIYFFSENPSYGSYKRLRIYNGSTSAISSLYLSGSFPTINNAPSYSIADLTKCTTVSPLMEFSVSSGAITNMYFTIGFNSSYPLCTTVPGANGGLISTLVKINPATGVSDTSQVPATYVSSNTGTVNMNQVPSLDGKIYVEDKNYSNIRKFDPATNTWSVVVGTGSVSSCPDGTLATSCAIDPGGAFVDAQSRLYFVDRGRIRTVQNGNVITLYGQTFNFGDGGLATNARFGLNVSVAERSDSKIIVLDAGSSRVRMFARGGNISTIAGNDTNGGNGSVSSAATAQSIPASTTTSKFFLDASDNLYLWETGNNMRMLPNTYLTDSTTKWFKFLDSANKPIFEGSTNAYYEPAANGALAGNLALTAINDSRFLGYNGSAFLMFFDQYSAGYLNGIFGEIAQANGRFSFNFGPTTGTTAICPDGTSLSSCTSGNFNSVSPAAAGWDPQNSLWMMLSNDSRTVRTFGSNRTGNTGTASVFSSNASAFVFKRFASIPSSSFFYYCDSASGKIKLRDVTSSTEVFLNWPIDSIKCTGTQIVYDNSTDSVIFSFTQNGLHGVAEVLNAHPSANGY